MKFMILALLAFCFITQARAQPAQFDPKAALLAVEQSVTDETIDLESRMRIALDLAHFYDVMKMNTESTRIYQKLTTSLISGSVRALADNEAILSDMNAKKVTDQMEKTGRPDVMQMAANFRADVIKRELRDGAAYDSQAPFKNDDERNLIKQGEDSGVMLLRIYESAPEFDALLKNAVENFARDQSDLQTVARANRLVKLVVYNMDADGKQVQNDARLQLEKKLLEQQAKLLGLEESPLIKMSTNNAIVAAQADVDKTKADIETNKAANPLWVDPRIQFDEAALKQFLCTSATLGVAAPVESIEAFNLLRNIARQAPWVALLKDCTTQVVDMKIPDRTQAVTAALATRSTYLDAPLKDCSVPAGTKIPKSDFRLYTCDQFLAFLRNNDARTRISAAMSGGCEAQGGAATEACLQSASSEAVNLPDLMAFPLLTDGLAKKVSDQAGDSTAKLEFQRAKIDRVFARIHQSDDLKNPENWNYRKQIRIKLSAALSDYIKLGASFPAVGAYIEENAKDAWLKDGLLVNLIEQAVNQSQPNLQFEPPKPADKSPQNAAKPQK